MWNAGSLKNHDHQQKRRRYGFWLRSSSRPNFPLLAPSVKIWKRASSHFTNSPSSLSLPYSPPSHSGTPSGYGCTSSAACVYQWLSSLYLCTSASLHCLFCPTSVSLVLVYVSLPHCCLPPSGFLSGGNRGANCTIPDDLSWGRARRALEEEIFCLPWQEAWGFWSGLVQGFSSLARFLFTTRLCTSTEQVPSHHTLRRTEEIWQFLPSPKRTTIQILI